MPVTSDTLFHYTKSLKNLENILSKKFLLTYCHETYILNYQTHDNYYPMISFCDIPLSLSKKQVDSYGSYAIGMTKEWGIRNKLNPVLYVEKDSLLGNDIQNGLDNTMDLIELIMKLITTNAAIIKDSVSINISAKNKTSFNALTDKIKSLKEKKFIDNDEKRSYLKSLTEELNKITALNEKLSNDQSILSEFAVSIRQINNAIQETAKNHLNLFRYIKNYKGTLIRHDKTIKNHRFYDEREWRYIPAINDKRLEARLNEEQYKKYRDAGRTKPFIKNINLPFTSDDIKYLIVKSSYDIPRLIKAIKSTDNLTKNSNEGDILTTRILTVEQLNNDF